jgi:phosphoribosylformimino-5-aminoimidazole carboxamide ribotide isomerase
MFLLPRLQISKGQCLDALDEPSEGEALPLTDPREVALRFQRMGAVGLHVVDVDQARGKKPNDEAILGILDAANVPVQCGGGVTSLRRIQELRDTGVTRVVVGSMGVLHMDWMREAAKIFPKGLVANIDEKDGHVMVKGRTVDSGKTLEDVALEFDSYGFEGLVLTSLGAGDSQRIRTLVGKLKTPTMVDRPILSLDELATFEEAGVQASILGKEIYDRTINFTEATKYFRTM